MDPGKLLRNISDIWSSLISGEIRSEMLFRVLVQDMNLWYLMAFLRMSKWSDIDGEKGLRKYQCGTIHRTRVDSGY